jgi:hypothetical protein
VTGLVGADVSQLIELSRKFEIESARFREIATSSTVAIQTAQWTGANIDRVRGEWNQSSKPSILWLADELSRLSRALRKNAEDQRSASGVGAGTFESRGGRHSRADGSHEWIGRLESLLGRALTEVELAKVALFLVDDIDLPILEKVLGPIGILLEGKEAFGRIADGNYAAALVNLLSGGTSLASWRVTMTGKASTLGPLAWGFAALVGFVDITMPVSDDEQDETISMGAQHLFGTGDVKDLTIAQAEQLRLRYQGPLGPVMMISDTMDATARKIFPWN